MGPSGRLIFWPNRKEGSRAQGPYQETGTGTQGGGGAVRSTGNPGTTPRGTARRELGTTLPPATAPEPKEDGASTEQRGDVDWEHRFKVCPNLRTARNEVLEPQAKGEQIQTTGNTHV